jgi:hypothetical protein
MSHEPNYSSRTNQVRLNKTNQSDNQTNQNRVKSNELTQKELHERTPEK